MLNLNRIIVVATVVLAGYGAILAQDNTFSDPSVEYSFVLPEAEWKMIAKPSGTSPNVEYVFNDRREGHLEVRRLAVPKDKIMTDIIRDEETKLQFLPGYVAGKEENFSGALRGNVFNYEFARAGRPMAGRFYFLRADDSTVYLLRFTGERDSLKSIRNQTDSIARTFNLKSSKPGRP
jgi:hypothetical protein